MTRPGTLGQQSSRIQVLLISKSMLFLLKLFETRTVEKEERFFHQR